MNVGSCGYDIRIGLRHLKRLGPLVRRLKLGTHPVVLTNPTILRSHAAAVKRTLAAGGFDVQMLTIPDTEQSKSLKGLSRLLSQLADLDRPGRRLFLLLVGGGVVGDLGGLAAGLYRRGIPYVQIPTTLLAQVDSSIGGKTAIDLPQGKNLVGLFYPPRLVFIEVDFLQTLPLRQLRSGLAEVAKCGVIRDAALFRFLERTSVEALRHSPRSLQWMIARAAQVKASMVKADEWETRGLRTLLNFGHTFGHAVEAAAGYRGTYTHGEAVAVGMTVATGIARELKMISSGCAQRIVRLVHHLGLPRRVRGVSLQKIMPAMSHDKKWDAGSNRWVLPTGIGSAVVRQGVPGAVVKRVIQAALEG